MNDEIYTEENLKLVGEWLGLVCDTYHDNLFPVDECTLCHDTTQLGAQIELFNDTPELIREALWLDDKILVSMDPVRERVRLFKTLQYPPPGDARFTEVDLEIVAVGWDLNKCQTGRTPLFEATAEYLKRRK